MDTIFNELWPTLRGNPWAIAITAASAVAGLAIVLGLSWTTIRAVKRHIQMLRNPADLDEDDRIDTFTVVVAMLALGVSGQGMYNVAGEVLHLTGILRWILFLFLELGAVASALRARKNTRKHGRSGVDGKAVWFIAALSGGISSLEELFNGNWLGVLIRFAAPLVAAWYWERALASSKEEFLRRTKTDSAHATARIQVLARLWDRVLVALKLADPEGRSVSEATEDRYLDKVAKRVTRLKWVGEGRLAVRRTYRRWLAQRALTAASMNTALGTDPVLAERLRGKLAAHGALDGLLTLELPGLMAGLSAPQSAFETRTQSASESAFGHALESGLESGSESASDLRESGFQSASETRTESASVTRTESVSESGSDTRTESASESASESGSESESESGLESDFRHGLRVVETRTESASESASESGFESGLEQPESPTSGTRTKRTRSAKPVRTRAGKLNFGKLPADPWEAAQYADRLHREATGRPISSETLRSALRIGKGKSDELVRMLRSRDAVAV